MFDWKILAASFAALLVVSSVLVGGFGFSDVLDQLQDWMGESPLGGFVSAPIRSSRAATVVIYPETFQFSLTGADFTSGQSEFTDFTGDVRANLTSDELTFLAKDSSFSVTQPLTEITFDKVILGKLSLEDTEFHVISHDLDTSSRNATLEVIDFSGSITLTADNVQMDGNVSSVRGNGKVIV